MSYLLLTSQGLTQGLIHFTLLICVLHSSKKRLRGEEICSGHLYVSFLVISQILSKKGTVTLNTEGQENN